MIYSGQLTEYLNFYSVVETQSQSGFKHEEEVYKFRVRGYRMKNKENYVVSADNLFHSTELTFLVRYRTDIKDTDIVVYEGERYRITSLNPFKQENQITIMLSKIND